MLEFAIVRAIRDDAKAIRSHSATGTDVQKALQRGDGVHIFDEAVTLTTLESKVWIEGQYVGALPGGGHRGDWDRFLWQSPTPIGWRIQRGKPDIPLFWGEIKGKINRAGDWAYHLVPRTGPAS